MRKLCNIVCSFCNGKGCKACNYTGEERPFISNEKSK